MLDPLAGKLDQYMTLLSVRQKLVASNIANADTPGYKTKDIDFESELQNAIAGSQPLATPLATGVPGLRVKNDGNNVDLDREARLLAENALRFSVASNLLRSQIKSVRAAIQGGSTSA
jgi:flagellar basal-body rod protein FlgB